MISEDHLNCSGCKAHLWFRSRILNAGGVAKSQADVESGLNESFTSAASKLDGDAAMLSPFLTEDAPEEVTCPPLSSSIAQQSDHSMTMTGLLLESALSRRLCYDTMHLLALVSIPRHPVVLHLCDWPAAGSAGILL